MKAKPSGLNKVTATTFQGTATDSDKLKEQPCQKISVTESSSVTVLVMLFVVWSVRNIKTSRACLALLLTALTAAIQHIRFCSSKSAARGWLQAAGYSVTNSWSAQQNFNNPIKMADGRIYFKDTYKFPHEYRHIHF